MSDVTVPHVTLSSPSAAPFGVTEDALIHAFIGAPFGDLEFDVGKSVQWTQRFVDDVFITDVNLGDPRYWIVNWEMSYPEAFHHVTSINYFVDPVAFRKEQFAKAMAQPGILLEDNDWALFVDAAEGLSCDTRSLPDDYLISPFRSYVHREITRAESAGRDNVVIPYFVFLKHADVTTYDYQIPGIMDRGEGLDSVQQSLGVPYYVANQGLARLWKVSALKNPAFDWTKIDQPQPWDIAAGTGTPSVPGYLTPSVGTVTTPDPGVVPTQCTFVFKMRGPNIASTVTNHCVVSQYESAGQRSWRITRHETNGSFSFIPSADGTAQGSPSRLSPARAPITSDDWLAVTYDVGATTTTLRLWSSTDGVAWTDRGAGTAVVNITPFDSSSVMRIGAQGATPIEVFDGRIYSVELRTGLDPSAGTLLWRFDASERTGSGTSYVDPRGRTWTLTNAAAITNTAAAVPAAPAAKIQIVSHAYAHWNMQDIEPPATTVEPLSASNDDGWRMRKLISMVRPQAGLPYTEPWKDPSLDVAGIQGPWAGQMKDAPVLGHMQAATFDASAGDFVSADGMDLRIGTQPLTWTMAVTPNGALASGTLLNWTVKYPDEGAGPPPDLLAWSITLNAGALVFSYLNLAQTFVAVNLGAPPTFGDPNRYLGVSLTVERTVTPLGEVFTYKVVGITSDGGQNWVSFGTPQTITPFMLEPSTGTLQVFSSFNGDALWAQQDAVDTMVWRFSPYDYRYDITPPAMSWEDRDITWTVVDDPSKFTDSTLVPNTVPAPDAEAAALLVPLYDCVFRINLRDGVWYQEGQLGNVPLIWDNALGTWVAAVPPEDWHETETFVAS